MSSRNRKITLAVILLVLVIIIFVMTLPKKSVWQETTIPYKADCGEDCQYITQVKPGHGGEALSLVKIRGHNT